MFEKFTDEAIRTIMFAQEESRRLSHNFVGEEQILLGLLHTRRVAFKILESQGIDLESARIEIESIIGRGSDTVDVEIPFTTRAKKVLMLSEKAARELNHAYIGTEHLLLGIAREHEGEIASEGGGIAAHVLRNSGVDLEQFGALVLEFIGEGWESVEFEESLPKNSAFERDYISIHTKSIGRLYDTTTNPVENVANNLKRELASILAQESNVLHPVQFDDEQSRGVNYELFHPLRDREIEIKNKLKEIARDELSNSSGSYSLVNESKVLPLASEFRSLPNSLAQLHRLRIYPPLSLVQDLLNFTSGQSTNSALDALAIDTSTRLPAVIKLRWPAAARVGIIAFLLQDIPFPDWEPPEGTTPTDIRNLLKVALSGEPCEPEAPPIPIAPLREAAKRVDERFLSLLRILGPKTVAQEPGLLLHLQHRIPELPMMNFKQQQLLGLRVNFGSQTGKATGYAPGAERSQVSGIEIGSRNDWSALVPSQLALPTSLLAYKHSRGELLYRSRALADPPQLRPVVLLLDVTPPVFGPVEATTRLVAFTVMQSLLKAGVPVVLVTTGAGEEVALPLDDVSDSIELWTKRSLKMPNVSKSLRLASAMAANLGDGNGVEPIILLLTHPWFGAESQEIPSVRGLRGLFVQYPKQNVEPKLAKRCERWVTLAAGQTSELDELLGYLFAGNVKQSKPKLQPRNISLVVPVKFEKESVGDRKTTATSAENWLAQIPERYKRLQSYLTNKQLREADRETEKVMLDVIRKTPNSYLRDLTIDEILEFPCDALQIIDHLWLHYSNGRFGFSSQKKIYTQCGAKLNGQYPSEPVWNKFGEHVGWRKNSVWCFYGDTSFNFHSPEGCLPQLLFDFSHVATSRAVFSALMRKIAECSYVV